MQLLNDPLAIMPVLYPALGATCLASALLLLLTYWLWDRTLVIAALSVHFFIEAVIMLVLTLSVGSNPLLDASMFRVWVVWLRFAMLVNLCMVIFWQMQRFNERRN